MFTNNFKVIFISFLGGTLEFYDFVIFVLFAKILSQVFFPKESTYLALIATFAIFAIGFFIRPMGGILLAHFGDKYGRKRIFMFTVFVMAISTTIIGLIPSYSSIGVFSPVLLLIFRLLQGFALGAEIPGAGVYVYEHMPKKYVLLGICCLFAGINFGSLLGSLVGFVTSHFFSNETFLKYGWRIPFIFGGVLGFVGVYTRRKLSETPLFIKIYDSGHTLNIPVLKIFKEYKKICLLGFCLASTGALVMTMFNMYLPTYLIDNAGYSFSNALKTNFYGLITLVLFMFLLGIFCIKVKINERLVYIISMLFIIFLSVAFFEILKERNYLFSLFSLMAMSLPLSISFCLFFVLILRVFPVEIRFSAVALCYNIGFAIFGGITPIMVTFLIHVTGNPMSVTYLIAAACIIGIISVICMKNISQQ